MRRNRFIEFDLRQVRARAFIFACAVDVSSSPRDTRTRHGDRLSKLSIAKKCRKSVQRNDETVASRRSKIFMRIARGPRRDRTRRITYFVKKKKTKKKRRRYFSCLVENYIIVSLHGTRFASSLSLPRTLFSRFHFDGSKVILDVSYLQLCSYK